jgi:hypothetical protein
MLHIQRGKIMRTILVGACALVVMTLPSTTAMAQSKLDKARAECRAQHANVAGQRISDRGGPSVSQQVAACVKRAMSGKG